MGLCEQGDCPEVIGTGDIQNNVQFNTIVVPEGATLSEVLVLMETYFNQTLLDLENDTFTLTEPNCLGLAAGDYGYQQIVTAMITVLCAVKTSVDTLDTDGVALAGGITVPSCMLPFTGTDATDLLNHIMTYLCTTINGVIRPVDVYNSEFPSGVPTLTLLKELHEGYADNDSYVYDHTTVVTSPTLLNITVQPMKAVVNNWPVKRVDPEVFALDKDRDIYFTLDDKGVISTIIQTIGDPAPSMTGKVYLYKITTDANGVVSYNEFFGTTPFNAPALSIPNNFIQTAMIDDLQVTGAKMESVVSASTKGHAAILSITYDAKGRITGATSNINLTGIADGQILKYDSGSGGFIPANERSIGTNGFIPVASGTDFAASSIQEDGSQILSSKKVEVNSGVAEDVAQAGLNVVTGTFMLPRYTATAASALAVFDGTVIYVTSTDGTFTSVGVWAVENSVWVKL